MNPLAVAYNELLFRPLFNLLVGITDLLPGHGIGLAIILVTLIVRLLLLPSSLHQVRLAQRQQAKMAGVQARLKQIQKQHAGDRSKQAEATMQAYREAGINPAGGCLPLLIQLPILFALYKVFLVGIKPETFVYLYSFVPAPDVIGTTFFGISLLHPSLLLGIIAGAAQFVLMKFFTPAPPAQPAASDESAQMMAAMQRNMTYFFPVMTVFIALQLPAALALYWVASTLFAIAQQYLLKRVFKVSLQTPAI